MQCRRPGAYRPDRGLGDGGQPLSAILITHPHPEHYAGAAVIAERGEPILVTPALAAVGDYAGRAPAQRQARVVEQMAGVADDERTRLLMERSIESVRDVLAGRR